MNAALADTLHRAGVRLEAAAGTLNGVVGRQDAAAVDAALDEYCRAKEDFAWKLTEAAGIRTELIERWLAL